jgi:hypothetical protein
MKIWERDSALQGNTQNRCETGKGRRVFTCAIEAEATGVGSTYSYTLSIGLPNSSRKIAWISWKGTDGALSKQFWNSCTYSAGNNVGADAMN